MLKSIAIATAICGTLDILFAIILTLVFGRDIPNMLRSVAPRPFPALRARSSLSHSGEREGATAATPTSVPG